MTIKETQPDALPTRKAMTAGSVALIVDTYLGPAVAEVWPQIMPSALSGPDVTMLAQKVVALAAGLAVAWFIRDRAGIPVQS